MSACLQHFGHFEIHYWVKPDAGDAGGCHTISAVETFMTCTRHKNLELAFNMHNLPLGARRNFVEYPINRNKVKVDGQVVCKAEKPALLMGWEIFIRCKSGQLVLVCNAGTGTDVIAAMALGHDVVAVEPDPQMFSVLVARVRNFAEAMVAEMAHLTFRRNMKNHFIERPLQEAEERKRLAADQKVAAKERTKAVRNFRRKSVVKTVTKHVPATKDADGVDVPGYDEEVEVEEVEVEDVGAVAVPAEEGAAPSDYNPDDNYDDPPNIADNAEALAEAIAAGQAAE